MRKTTLTIATIVIAGLASAPFAAGAKTHKHSRHHMSTMDKSATTGSATTTGANMKSSTGARGDTSSDGNVGPGTSNNNTKPVR